MSYSNYPNYSQPQPHAEAYSPSRISPSSYRRPSYPQNTTSPSPSYHVNPTSPSYANPTQMPPQGVPNYNYDSQDYTHPAMTHSANPSYSYNQHDFPDETKSYSSTAHLNLTPSKEYDVGHVLPQSYNYPPESPYAPPGPGYFSAPGAGGPGWQSPNPYAGTQHWTRMRNQLLERRVVQQIPLHNGNLVMDVPVPKGVRPNPPIAGIEPGEMDSLRYSAVTCDPDEFMAKKFTLRQYLSGRKTELFVGPSREQN